MIKNGQILVGQQKDKAGRYYGGLELGDQLLLARSWPTWTRKKYNMGGPVGVDLPGSTAEMTASVAGPRLGQEAKNKVGMLNRNMMNSGLEQLDFAFGNKTFPIRKSFSLGSDSGCFSHGKTDFFPYGYSRPEKNNAVPREERSLAGRSEKLFESMGKVCFPKAKSKWSKALFTIF